MKKKIFSIAAFALVMLTGCSVDINDNPNYPSKDAITPSLQFPAVINAIATSTGDQMFNYAGFFSQYFEQAPEANQYNRLAELDIDESSDLFNRTYRQLYAGALLDIKDIQGKTTNTSNLFALQVMRTLAFQLLVDNTDKTPYTEALQGSAVASPAYDDGQAVYEGVLAELDEAEKALGSELMDMTDPMLDDNLAQWKGFANAIRLRMYLRLIDGGVKAADYTAKVKALLAANEFFTGDVKWDVYDDTEGQFNPWYGSIFKLNASNHVAAYPIVEYMKSMNDPRISYAISPRASDGTYVGQFPGAKQANEVYGSTYKNVSVSFIATKDLHDAPIYLFTQAELQFLIAEAQLRFNNNVAAAKTAYEAGVAADFSSRNVAGSDAFLSTEGSFDAQSTTDAKLKLIYMQKWNALFMRDHMEAWSEIRRTDVPAISSMTIKQIQANPAGYSAGDLILPYYNFKGNGGLCKSIPYSSDSRKYNKNTPTARAITDKVFWDAK